MEISGRVWPVGGIGTYCSPKIGGMKRYFAVQGGINIAFEEKKDVSSFV